LAGCTVHLVTEAVDGGPILAQAAVEVKEGDTPERFEARVHEVEHRLYPAAVHDFLARLPMASGRPGAIPAGGRR
jgi:phosphoribosylglycinamide formyltransferase-1